ncbi:MAG TPA: MOSC domain-containing protein [Piscinibacter sp.]|jgi:MOSC domain-containing protein YiiM|nr:MOSC domain-containing protein [Piscinibacter sp.]
MLAKVVAVHSSPQHAFSKADHPSIELIEGHGVKGDAHFGVTVKHRSRVARDPTQPNLRQVHLLHQELLRELAAKGLAVSPGQMGENITTRGLELLRMSVGTRLRIGSTAVVELTGLRNPCAQIESFKPGLLAAVLDKANDGSLIRKAGVMGVVLTGGLVYPGDEVVVVHHPLKYSALHPV